MLIKDRIRNGLIPTFPGHAAYKQLMWLVLPLLLAFHASVLFVTTRARQNRTVVAYFRQVVQPPAADRLQQRHGVYLNMLKECVKPGCAMGICGILLTILNYSSEVCADTGGCGADPIIQGTR